MSNEMQLQKAIVAGKKQQTDVDKAAKKALKDMETWFDPRCGTLLQFLVFLVLNL